jgi:hypothetical protein
VKSAGAIAETFELINPPAASREPRYERFTHLIELSAVNPGKIILSLLPSFLPSLGETHLMLDVIGESQILAHRAREK